MFLHAIVCMCVRERARDNERVRNRAAVKNSEGNLNSFEILFHYSSGELQVAALCVCVFMCPCHG